jgi:hypothetical protein
VTAGGGGGGGRGSNVVGTGGAITRTVWLTSGPMRFSIYLNYPNRLKLEN